MPRRRQNKKRNQDKVQKVDLPSGGGRRAVNLFIKDARYYPEEKSIAIIGEEVESRRPITTQALVTDFIQEFGLVAAEDDHDAWRFFADQLSKREHPITLAFTATYDKSSDEI